MKSHEGVKRALQSDADSPICSSLISRMVSHSPQETFSIGKEWGRKLVPSAIVCFQGELAAGKTTMIKGFVEGAADIPGEEVHSPTFAYLHIYEGKQTIYHFDLYRLSGVGAFLEMGFDEYFSSGGICFIEWSERISSLLSEKAWKVSLRHLGGDHREIVMYMPS